MQSFEDALAKINAMHAELNRQKLVQPKKPRAKRKKRTAQCPVCYESEPVKYGYNWKCRICETWVYDGGYGPDSYEIDEKYKAMIKKACKGEIEKMRKAAQDAIPDGKQMEKPTNKGMK